MRQAAPAHFWGSRGSEITVSSGHQGTSISSSDWLCGVMLAAAWLERPAAGVSASFLILVLSIIL